MCGFVISLNKESINQREFINSALKKLKNRGPDQQNMQSYLDDRLWLGHTRLSINDFTSAGLQPMNSNNGNAIVFNGEIYNFKEIAEDFNFNDLKSKCDTEVLLRLLNEVGIKKSLNIINGMFAFAYFDSHNSCIWIAVDRFGEKPIYFYKNKSYFIASSQLDVITSNKIYSKNINPQKVFEFLSYGYISGGDSIYKDVKRVEPGMLLRIDVNNLNLNLSHYSEIKSHDKKSKLKLNINDMKNLLIKSVERQLSCDAKKGFFLSSGTDSSLVASIASKELGLKYPTFCFSSDVLGWDESKSASNIAKELELEFYKVSLKSNSILNFLDIQPKIFNEPFADLSQLATYEISKFAKSNCGVSVLLGGDGADELFCGYGRLKYASLINRIERLKIKNIFHNLFSFTYSIMSKYFDNQFVYRLEKAKNFLTSDFNDSYLKLSSTHPDISQYISKTSINNAHPNNKIFYIIYKDLSQYLPWNNLVKIDRSCMANGVEGRSPFLDKELTKLLLMHNPKDMFGKIHIKKLLSKYIDKKNTYKPKKGFGVPIHQLFDKEIMDRLKVLFDMNIDYFPFLNKKVISAKIEQSYYNKLTHLDSIFLWKLLILLNWKSKS